VSQHEEDEDFLTGIENASDEPEFVATDIKDDTISNDAGSGEDIFDISPRMPANGGVADMLVPSLKGSLRGLPTGEIPELAQTGFRDDAHRRYSWDKPIRQVSIILVRKTRTGNPRSPKANGQEFGGI